MTFRLNPAAALLATGAALVTTPGTATALPPPPPPPGDEEPTTGPLYRLTVDSVYVVRHQERSGDEVQIGFGRPRTTPLTVWCREGMVFESLYWDSTRYPVVRTFDATAVLTVTEMDGPPFDPHDFIGTITVRREMSGTGIVTRRVSNGPNGAYDVNFHVDRVA